MLALHLVNGDDWRVWRATRLEALRDAPNAFGSHLADWQGQGDTEVRWRRRLEDVPFNLIAELDGEPAGMVSATHSDEAGATALISMWVARFARGRGVGDALIDAVVKWAREGGYAKVVLDVRESNTNALALYARHGFVDEGRIEPKEPGEPFERRMSFRIS